jgi:ATP-dependent exoDNAse (exonuclease V) beta subunit
MIYLDYLESQEEAGNIQDPVSFENGLTALYASPDLDADDTLQIMTIHKAKGLEFDTVIVPGLGRGSRNRDKQLLKWMEQPHSLVASESGAGLPDLLLAPIQETGAAIDPIYTWVEKLDWDKAQFEADRLLYVAATRAKKFLHLLGHINGVSEESGQAVPSKPLSGSLLDRLWLAVLPAYSAAAVSHFMLKNNQLEGGAKKIIGNDASDQSIHRLKTGWVLPGAPEPVAWQVLHEQKTIQAEIEFSWASEMARHVGNVVHRWLQKIAEDQMCDWNIARIEMMRERFTQNLMAGGMNGSQSEMTYAVERIVSALNNAISDKRGQWILGPQQSAQNELKISGIANGRSMSWIIDRTFCDSNGIRWIIDYKTSSHEGSAREDFLDREQIRYQHQLNHYAKLMRQIDSRPIRLGIYFPLINGWREW